VQLAAMRENQLLERVLVDDQSAIPNARTNSRGS
jgi:hypothetical protein